MIKIKNLYKIFDGKNVLNNLSLDIKEGECVVICGVSGSGKSTLLSIISSFIAPTSGLVMVDGVNIISLSDFHISNYRAKTIGFVTQEFHLFDRLSVEQNVMIPLILTDLSQSELQQRCNKAITTSAIGHKKNQIVSKLSGGEKQRCVIARALVNEPKVILCDEPTANLDKENSLGFTQIVRELKSQKKTIIIATHDPLIINLEFVDRVIEIDDGKIE